MARPSKSVKVKSGAIASDEQQMRQQIEDELRGADKPPSPPKHLSNEQKNIFRMIVKGMKDSGVLGKLDVFVLETTAIAIDRLRAINEQINESPSLLSNAALQNARSKYQSDFWRGCSELCLSPQARAKIGSLAAAKNREASDPLLDALKDDD